MESGVLGGFPCVDVAVTLIDGSYHDVDSNEMAFKIAGSMGFRNGAMEADPVLLEPVMKVEVVTPEDYMGDVMGDLNKRRGVVQGMDETPAGKTVSAEVPLAEMFGNLLDGVFEVRGNSGKRYRILNRVLSCTQQTSEITNI